MQSAGDDSFSLTLALLVDTINKQRPVEVLVFSLALFTHYDILIFLYFQKHETTSSISTISVLP